MLKYLNNLRGYLDGVSQRAITAWKKRRAAKVALSDFLSVSRITKQELRSIERRLLLLQKTVRGCGSHNRRVRNQLIRGLMRSQILAKLSLHQILGTPSSPGLGVDWRTRPQEIDLLELARLAKASGRKRVWLLKPDYSLRGLAVPSLKDRVRERSLLTVLEILASKYQSANSIGFRLNQDRHRGLHSFLERAVKRYGVDGFNLLDTDFRKYFDTIPHEGVHEWMRILHVTGEARQYIRSSLQAPIIDDPGNQKNREVVLAASPEAQMSFKLEPHLVPKAGVPQGGVLSPLFANLYGTGLDRALEERGLPHLRYADNLLLAYPKHWEQSTIIELVESCTPKGITLHSGKTQHLVGDGKLVTLGCVIVREGGKLRLLIGEGYRRVPERGPRVPMAKTFGGMKYLAIVLRWVRNLEIHRTHQTFSNRGKWAKRNLGPRVYLSSMNSFNVKAGVYREVTLGRITGRHNQSLLPLNIIKVWGKGRMERISLPAMLDSRLNLIQGIERRIKPMLSIPLKSSNFKNLPLSAQNAIGGNNIQFSNLKSLTKRFRVKSDRYQLELNTRVYISWLRENPGVVQLPIKLGKGTTQMFFPGPTPYYF